MSRRAQRPALGQAWDTSRALGGRRPGPSTWPVPCCCPGASAAVVGNAGLARQLHLLYHNACPILGWGVRRAEGWGQGLGLLPPSPTSGTTLRPWLSPPSPGWSPRLPMPPFPCLMGTRQAEGLGASCCAGCRAGLPLPLCRGQWAACPACLGVGEARGLDLRLLLSIWCGSLSTPPPPPRAWPPLPADGNPGIRLRRGFVAEAVPEQAALWTACPMMAEKKRGAACRPGQGPGNLHHSGCLVG